MNTSPHRLAAALLFLGCTSPRSLPVPAPGIQLPGPAAPTTTPSALPAPPDASAGLPSPPDAAPDLPAFDLSPDFAPPSPPDAASAPPPDAPPDAPPDLPPDLPPAPPPPACQDACTPGTLDCGPKGPRACVRTDTCTRWGPEQPCHAGLQCRAGKCQCPDGQLWCDTTNRCHLPVLCLLEHTGGYLNAKFGKFTAFCSVAPGGENAPDVNGRADSDAWAPVADDGTCDAFNAKALAHVCEGSLGTGTYAWPRRLVYDPATGALKDDLHFAMYARCPDTNAP